MKVFAWTDMSFITKFDRIDWANFIVAVLQCGVLRSYVMLLHIHNLAEIHTEREHNVCSLDVHDLQTLHMHHNE